MHFIWVPCDESGCRKCNRVRRFFLRHFNGKPSEWTQDSVEAGILWSFTKDVFGKRKRDDHPLVVVVNYEYSAVWACTAPMARHLHRALGLLRRLQAKHEIKE